MADREEGLPQSEERYRLMVETAAIGIAMGTPDRRLTEINSCCSEMLGYSREELLGQFSTLFGHPEDEEVTTSAISRLLSGETDSVAYERRYVRKDGSFLWAHTTVAAVRDFSGEVRTLVVTMQDISSRKEMEESLREADRRKDEFLAMLGHELRNPLAPIRNAVQILNERGRDGDLIEQRAREIIDRQAAHMARLIDDLLDVARISRGKILLRPRRLDLTELVRATVEDHRDDLETAGLEVELNLPETPVWIDGDSTRISQAMGNLLHNARKFTDPGGKVTVHLEEDPRGGTASMILRDTGIGMEPEMLERLFETFSQADRSLDRSRGGLGLGLALVKGLIEQHGGEVRAESDGPGCGSRFTIRLPRSSQPASETRTEPEPSLRVSRRILVIEDHADTAESLKLLLEMSGHEVETAPDGRAGLGTARSEER